MLSADPALAVTFLAVTRAAQQCAELPRLLAGDMAQRVAFRCLEPSHFEPKVCGLHAWGSIIGNCAGLWLRHVHASSRVLPSAAM